jgi:hypothetical protein
LLAVTLLLQVHLVLPLLEQLINHGIHLLDDVLANLIDCWVLLLLLRF